MKKNQKIPKYNFKSIEKKWQKFWQEEKVFQPDMDKAKKPFYNLMMFPYPSAEGLHVGSAYTFSGVDTFGRFKKLQGYDVFEPIGLDGFGIHSENFAMKIGQHIKDVSKRTEKNYYRQLHQIGNMHDWSRTVETYKPEYYKWTQWLFLQMLKNGLAYQKKAKVNWCPSCKTVLSDEQVIGGQCERCDSFVQKKQLKQWFFRITKYADRLLKNLDWIDWPEDIKTNQRNWIGKSEGATIKFAILLKKQETRNKKQTNFKIQNSNSSHLPLAPSSGRRGDFAEYIEVFTTRPDTLFGATYMVVAPELAGNWKSEIGNWEEVEKYVKKSMGKSEEERKADEKQKTGIELKGIYAINPATGEEIPIWVADYVLGDYGTGAIMAVPAHDRRDYEFALKFGLPIKQVLMDKKQETRNKKQTNSTNHKSQTANCFSGDGISVNSGFLNGLETNDAKKEMIKWLEKTPLNPPFEKGGKASRKVSQGGFIGKKTVDFKLRDWCVSRQRYWGPPIPVVFCKQCALKRKKTKVLIVHGFEVDNKSNWFPWIKKELEKIGCEVFVPNLPNSAHPNSEKWLKALQPYLKKLDENSILIGHSLGSKAALDLLAKTDKKIAQLFLVASALGNPKRNWDKMQEKLPGSDIDSLRKFWEKKVDWKSVNDSVLGNSHVIISKDDAFVDYRHYKIIELDDLKIQKWDGHHHFTRPEDAKLRDYLVEQILKDIEPEAVPVPEKDLPVKLPPMDDFLPEGKGKGPLAKNEKFVHVKCPVCGAMAERETDVSDPFVDSAWYFFRYPSTEIADKPFDKKRTKKWLPVDSYIGGKEHTVLHLLYSRFVTMVLNDLGHIDFDEPYKRFFGHGLITKDGAKMSKSKGNVVNPDEMIEKFGADAMRLYLRFVGDFSQGGDWRDTGIEGMARFVKRMWIAFHTVGGAQSKGADVFSEAQAKVLNMSMVDKTVKVIGEDLERLSFNTAVARLMEYVNWMRENSQKFNKVQAKKAKETLAFVLAPMAPHIAEEMWLALGNKNSIFTAKWPKFDEKNVIEQTVEIVVQVNGKVRDKFFVSKDVSESQVKELALKSEKIQPLVNGKEIKKVIYIPGRLVSIVM